MERRLSTRRPQAGFTISALQQRCRQAAIRRFPRFTRASFHSDGFTIVELMIATLVFSLVLVVITVGVIRFTNDYYRGVSSSATQTAAQNAIDTVSQAIQFSSGGTSSGNPNTHFCAGNKVFVYSKGVRFSGEPTAGNLGLYMAPSTPGTCSVPDPLPLSNGGTELLGDKMRVADAVVKQLDPADPASPWSVSLKIAYGDADLLCRTSITGMNKGGCSSGAQSYDVDDPVAGSDVTCKAQLGSQFCSVATVSTVVTQRIQN